MTRWEEAQTWITDNGVTTFTAVGYANLAGITTREASDRIQALLDAQRRGVTSVVLRRQPGTRTSSSVWRVGARAEDVRRVGDGFASDVRRRLDRAVRPDLETIGQHNPRALPVVQAHVAFADAAISTLERALKNAGNGVPTP